MTCRHRIPSLPQEVLLAICKLTQPPPYYYDPSIRRGPRNPWLECVKTNKALVLVCKAWSAPATELLYTDIVLRRMGQISALANTFRTDRHRSISGLVRSIGLNMCVVLTHCADVVREDFEFILSQCTALLAFAFNLHPHSQFPLSNGPPDGQLPSDYAVFDPTWVLDPRDGRAGSFLARLLSSRLLTLELDLTTIDDSFRPLAQILSSAPHITSLSLGSIPWEAIDSFSDPSSPLPELVFPALETLSINCEVPRFIAYVRTRWRMARLTHLTCMDAEHIPIALLETHGTRLTYLSFLSSQAVPQHFYANAVFFPRLDKLCPALSHLVVIACREERVALNIHSPSLRYLDIVAHASVAEYRAMALAHTARAPQLRKVRMVIAPHACFPLLFHPSHMPGSDSAFEDLSDIPGARESDERADWLMRTTGGIEAVLPELHVRQHTWAIVEDALCEGMLPPPSSGGDARVPDDEDTDSEDKYVYESAPSSPSSTEESDSDGEADQVDESDSDMTREWFEVEPAQPPYPQKVAFVDDPLDASRGQYDRQTVLECFSRSQLGDFLVE